jgi:clorobiocin biosynthesis protein CloN3
MEFELTGVQRERCGRIFDELHARLGSRRPDPDPAATRADWKVLAEVGLTGLCLPPEYGGGGLGALDTALCLEAAGRACPDTGLVFALSAHLLAGGVPIRDFGAGPRRGSLLAGLASGEVIAANAMTEDGAGSDVGRLALSAERAGAGYRLTGEKSFVSNAPIADVVVTYAVTEPAAGFLGISAFAVPREVAGWSTGPPLRKMGLTSCPAARVRFDSCALGPEHLLGAEGQGAAIFQHSMEWERACLFAGYLGLLDRQLRQCVRHAAGRQQFGRPIGRFQAVSHRIATMKQRLDSARLLVYRACWLLDEQRDRSGAIALAKLAVTEAAVANSLAAVQVFGGAGYLDDPDGCGIERQLRDCVPTSLFSGTTEIQRELIAKDLGL